MKNRVLKFNDFDVNENYSSLNSIMSEENEFDIYSSHVELSESEFISLFDPTYDHLTEADKAGKKAGAWAKTVNAAKLRSKDIPEVTPEWNKEIEEYMKTRGNHFRAWVNSHDSSWAKENKLDPKGSYNNLYIKKAWKKFGMLYIRLLVRSRKIKQENKDNAKKLAASIGLRLSKPNWGKTSDGNTVTGGLFDFNDRKTYEAVKDMKNMVINGVKYTFVTFGEGLKSIGGFLSKTAKSAGNFLLKLAEYTGKTIVFTGELVYVVGEEVVKGLTNLATSMWGYAKKGAVVIGNTVAAGLRTINEFFVSTGEKIGTAFKAAGNFVTNLCEGFMQGLYNVAKQASKAAEAIAALTVAAYNKTKEFFSKVADFSKRCIYGAANKVKQTAIKIGQSIKDFYDASVKIADEAKKSIEQTFKAGYEKAKQFVSNAYAKTKKYVSNVKNKVVSTYKKVQDKVVNTAKEIYSHGVAIFKGLFDNEGYQGYGKSIFESYIEFGNGERFYIPLGETQYNYNEDLV